MENMSLAEYFSQSLENKVYDLTKNGKCTECGSCCSRILPLSKEEIKQIKRYVKANNIKECKHLSLLVKKQVDLNCPFLDTSKSCEKCSIYEVRPMICRKFICSRKQRMEFTLDEIKQERNPIDMRETFYGGKSWIEECMQ